MNLEVISGNEAHPDVNFITTFTGRKFHIFNTKPEDIHIRDIAHGLAMTCRWGGQCSRFFSVAEHSVGVAENCPEDVALLGLLHDAAEAYIGDIPSPFKDDISNYRDIERAILKVIFDKYGVSGLNYNPVKAVDERMMHTEAAILLPDSDWIAPSKIYHNHKIMGLAPAQAEELFLLAFSKLYHKR